MGRCVDLDERVTAQFYDEECEEWTMQTCTIEDVLDSVCDEYTVLPSVQPEQRWIPCSEKLPEARGLYLTTTKDKVVYCDYWNEDNFNRTEMVIAWMPLPEPWEGKEQ